MTLSDSGPMARRTLWVMLLALCCAFTLSQAFRTVAAMMAKPLQAELGLSNQQLGLFAGAFHFAFGAMQLFMGVGIDLHGIRRTVLIAFPLAIAGSALSALASSYPLLLAGQVLIGIGCAPAFLVCTVFIARNFPAARFAAVSGLIMSLGGIGLLLTGTPLAWLIEVSSWRAGFAVLGVGSALAWLVVFALVRDTPAPAAAEPPPRESLPEALRAFGALFAVPHTWGIMVLGAVTYSSFIALRGLWLGPLLIERYGYTLVQSGNVALAVSVVSLLGPPLFGRLRTQGRAQRHWIIGFTLLMAAAFAALALSPGAHLAVAGVLLSGFLSGYIVLQYADVRAAYPAALTGRALAVFTMAMFLGIALVQWLTGLVATYALAHGIEPYTAVLFAIAALLAMGALAFAALPAPASAARPAR
ncbi:MFS transporter [Variovorax terrae]|uniref:MFS transporter n=1 Tax=Variovorax terrae TaxID=2923278 RepID=A0A9X1W408_9BURK|nr:MFS transporter [Variovorax terrae]MCJ0765398.1 MFS transporter [Variovorax terrae]